MPRLQSWLEARWYGGRKPAWWLRGLSALFAGLTALRRLGYARGWLRSTRLPVPVLVVGNLSVGGAGKTPLVIALCAALRARGWRPGVISRGYGRSERAPRRVETGSRPEEVGDEPLLIHRRSGCPVAVAADRVEAGRLLLDSAEVDLLIADDGLQHYALQRDLEVLVIDGQRRFGNGLLLPAGPLRESAWRAATCAARVVNSGEAKEGEWDMQLVLGPAVPLNDGPARALSGFKGQPLHAIAGIGHPERFFAALRAQGLDVQAHPFPDHHPFSAADFTFDTGRPLLMTEKDAAKCQPFARPGWYQVGVDALLSEALFDTLHARLIAAKAALDE